MEMTETYAETRPIVAHNVRRYRRFRKMTQAQLAESAGVSTRTVHVVEDAGGDGFSLGTLCALSHALAVAPATLLKK